MRFEIWQSPDGKRLARERYVEVPFSGYFTEEFEGPHLFYGSDFYRDIETEEEDLLRTHLGLGTALIHRLTHRWVDRVQFGKNLKHASLRAFRYGDREGKLTRLLPPMRFLKNMPNISGHRGSGGCVYVVPGSVSLRGVLLRAHTDQKNITFGDRYIEPISLDAAQLTHAEQVKLDQLLDRGLA